MERAAWVASAALAVAPVVSHSEHIVCAHVNSGSRVGKVSVAHAAHTVPFADCIYIQADKRRGYSHIHSADYNVVPAGNGARLERIFLNGNSNNFPEDSSSDCSHTDLNRHCSVCPEDIASDKQIHILVSRRNIWFLQDRCKECERTVDNNHPIDN